MITNLLRLLHPQRLDPQLVLQLIPQPVLQLILQLLPTLCSREITQIQLKKFKIGSVH